MLKTRKVVCVRTGACAHGLLDELGQRGWHVERVEIPTVARGEGKYAGCRVGVVCIPEPDSRLLDELEETARFWRRLELIAVVGPTVIADPRCDGW